MFAFVDTSRAGRYNHVEEGRGQLAVRHGVSREDL